MTRRGWLLGAPWQAWVALMLLVVLVITRSDNPERPLWRSVLIGLVIALFLWGLVVRAITRKAA